ncbi:MAG: HupE/UreJ family protein [Candidatus Marinimicrobia bacterium]|nr:HupE/UreJ family protein [Candidatus Neomarinimicrobiota bacterium]MBL7023764.1 HupE/UreJ family protein [Candidatus Neomarinimicrobiota bacterium]MBL7109403.1 HupE/UreJ family protein [Candidatus Neomarinimicrobiota bacterium]
MKNLLLKLSLFIPNLIFAHGVSDADKVEMVQGKLFDFFYLGAKHMITGYDHILFLIGVIFFLTKFTDIAKFITAFTIGHSVTLVFATFYEINANYYLIDAVIAFSVIYKGFENLDGFNKWFSIEAPNKTAMVLLFGLIHGFGLSTRLQQIDLGHHGLLSKIISFNAGVEIGQIGALVIAFPLLILLRKQVSNITKITNIALMFIGSLLLIFQLNGFFTTDINPEVIEEKQIEVKVEEPKEREKVDEKSHQHSHGNETHKNHSH